MDSFTAAVKSKWFTDLIDNENKGISSDRDNHNINKIGIEVKLAPVNVFLHCITMKKVGKLCFYRIVERPL